MGIGGPARYFVTPRSREELVEVVKRCRENDVAIKVLGQGANLLVLSERVEAAVIHLGADCFTNIEIDGSQVRAAAGADLPRLVRQCIRAGLSGLEPLVGIPGTVGGGVRMNAGDAPRRPEILTCYRSSSVWQRRWRSANELRNSHPEKRS